MSPTVRLDVLPAITVLICIKITSYYANTFSNKIYLISIITNQRLMFACQCFVFIGIKLTASFKPTFTSFACLNYAVKYGYSIFKKYEFLVSVYSTHSSVTKHENDLKRLLQVKHAERSHHADSCR